MDRKLFLSYVQNMQQNNPDMIAFQNSITKNSWQKPRSIVEMNGGGHVYQGDFDARDRMEEPARRANEEGLKAIMGDVRNIAAEAYQEFLANGGKRGSGHHGFSNAEATDYLREHPSWKNLSDNARDDVIGEFIEHIGVMHRR